MLKPATFLVSSRRGQSTTW